MAEEAVPVKTLRRFAPSPVRLLRVGEDDARLLVTLRRVAPDVPVALQRVGRGARILEPGVLVGGVVDDEVCDDTYAARVCGFEEGTAIFERAVVRQYRVV